MINLSSTNLSPLNLGGMNTSEIKLGYPSSGCPVPGLKGLQGLYMGKGLTNEMMSRDPIWRDKSGKGNHIALKNFAWGGMSGVGLYAYDFKTNLFDYRGPSIGSEKHSDRFIITKVIGGQVNIQYKDTIFKCKIKVSGINEAIDRGEITSLRIYNSANSSIGVILKSDGVYNIDIVGSSGYIYFFAVGRFAYAVDLQTSIIIEQIPDYDGAICFDGVDDFGETIKDLNFTDNYSVVSLVVPFYRLQNQIMFGKNYLKDVYCNYSTSLSFYSAGKSVYTGGGQLSTNKVRLLVCRRNESIQEIKDVISGISKSDIPNSVIDNPGKYYMGRSQTVFNYGQFAMFAHAIFDHYISDNELQILSDYWKKEFPELFPDQAWTVTGKANSDADRATIKNITGNGNDLVLTNFGFAENSGYGLYKQNFNTWKIDDGIIRTSDKITFPAGFTMGSLPVINNKYDKTSLQLTLNVSGVYDNILLFKRRVVTDSGGISEKYITLKNGINKISVDDISADNWVISFGFQSFTWGTALANDLTIEQIPDYEGYLVTDGVDDQITSGNINFGDNWTMVGDWEFLKGPYNNSGIAAPNNLFLYSRPTGMLMYIKRTSLANSLNGISTLKAICSDGRVYDEYWNEIKLNTGTLKNATPIRIGYLNENHTKMAFKNLALHNNIILTKEQCIRSYNYLQTIKNN